MRAAEIGMMASLGIGEIAVYRGAARGIFFHRRRIGRDRPPLGAGQIYDSNRYTMYGMLTRLGLRSAWTWA